MKKFTTIISILILAGCSASSAEATPVRTVTIQPDGQSLVVSQQIVANRAKISKVIKQVESRIGKTWYVFSGDQPTGWDCSGLTRWAYAQMGIDIPHSATKQSQIGTIVRRPAVGDLVLFGYKNSKSYYHAALYVGSGIVIHAGFRRGTTTQLIPLTSAAFKGSKITFVRILNTGA